MPKRPVQTPITDQEIAFAHLVLAGTMTDKAAAKVVGIDPRRAAYVKNKPKVQAYMEEHRASVRSGLVQHEVEALAKFNIGRERILAKWWEFANIDPAKGYNTSSQSRALELLWKGLGYADADPKKPGYEDEPEKLDVYRAKWMRKPGDSDYEEDEGETAGSRETRTRCEPIMSGPEPPPRTAWPAMGPESLTVSPRANTTNSSVESTEPSRFRPGGSFGRFQGL
jgi:hypothetical protein